MINLQLFLLFTCAFILCYLLGYIFHEMGHWAIISLYFSEYTVEVSLNLFEGYARTYLQADDLAEANRVRNRILLAGLIFGLPITLIGWTLLGLILPFPMWVVAILSFGAICAHIFLSSNDLWRIIYHIEFRPSPESDQDGVK